MRSQSYNARDTGPNYRVGRRIRVPEVRVIGADGSQVGIIPTQQALKMAEDAGLELVEVNPRSAPPVCRIMDFGKFKYETAKKEKDSRKHQATVLIKEIKLRPKTGKHDFDFKMKHIREFLGEGNKCKLVVVFRGREIVHPETGQAVLDHVVKDLGDTAIVEQRPSMEGRRMMMLIGPKAGVIRPAPPRPTPAPKLDEAMPGDAPAASTASPAKAAAGTATPTPPGKPTPASA